MSDSVRQVDLVNVAWEARTAASRGQFSTKQLRKDYWVDLSQTVSMKPWATSLKAFRGRGHLYSFECDRCLDGVDLFRLCGWPKSVLLGTPPGDALYLAADSTSLPLVTLVQAVM